MSDGVVGPDGFTRLAETDCRDALEMARKAYAAERRAEEAEYHAEQLRDALDSAERIGERAAELATERDAALARIARTERLIDSWERDAPEHSNPVFVGRLRECLRRNPAPVQLREFAKPKPDEPTGLGAVVEDAEGVKWVRLGRPGDDPTADDWRRAGWTSGDESERVWHFYADIDAVKVLSEGVPVE